MRWLHPRPGGGGDKPDTTIEDSIRPPERTRERT